MVQNQAFLFPASRFYIPFNQLPCFPCIFVSLEQVCVMFLVLDVALWSVFALWVAEPMFLSLGGGCLVTAILFQ